MPTSSYAHDGRLETAVEVHSAWGTFEWLLQDAFEAGYRVGIVANSDGHKGRPGACYPGASFFGSYGGLTCFLADAARSRCDLRGHAPPASLCDDRQSGASRRERRSQRTGELFMRDPGARTPQRANGAPAHHGRHRPRRRRAMSISISRSSARRHRADRHLGRPRSSGDHPPLRGGATSARASASSTKAPSIAAGPAPPSGTAASRSPATASCGRRMINNWNLDRGIQSQSANASPGRP